MFITDSWVDLRRTGHFLYGTDVRTRFPEPPLNSLARESVLIACLSAIDTRGGEYLHWPFDHPKPDDFFFGRLSDGGVRGLAKSLTWLTTDRLASMHGYAPTSAADALQVL